MTQLPRDSNCALHGLHLTRALFEAGEAQALTPPPDCARCGHPADAHHLDDSLNVDPTDPTAPFRCVGYTLGGRWIDTACNCPDYQVPDEHQH